MSSCGIGTLGFEGKGGPADAIGARVGPVAAAGDAAAPRFGAAAASPAPSIRTASAVSKPVEGEDAREAGSDSAKLSKRSARAEAMAADQHRAQTGRP